MGIMFSSNRFTSSVMIEEYGQFLLGQLDAYGGDVEGVGVEFREKQAGLIRLLEEKKDLHRDLQGAQGKLYWAEEEFYDEIRIFHNHLLAEVEFDRSHHLYRKYFPGGLNQLGRLSVTRQVEEIREVLAVMDQSRDFTSLPVERLQTSLENTEAVIEELHSAKNVLKLWREREKEAKREWSWAYREVYHDLLAAFDHQRRKANRFFKRLPSRKKSVSQPVEVPAETGEEEVTG